MFSYLKNLFKKDEPQAMKLAATGKTYSLTTKQTFTFNKNNPYEDENVKFGLANIVDSYGVYGKQDNAYAVLFDGSTYRIQPCNKFIYPWGGYKWTSCLEVYSGNYRYLVRPVDYDSYLVDPYPLIIIKEKIK